MGAWLGKLESFESTHCLIDRRTGRKITEPVRGAAAQRAARGEVVLCCARCPQGGNRRRGPKARNTLTVQHTTQHADAADQVAAHRAAVQHLDRPPAAAAAADLVAALLGAQAHRCLRQQPDEQEAHPQHDQGACTGLVCCACKE